MRGTIRTFNDAMKKDIHGRIKNTADMIAQSAGASAEVTIASPYKVIVNDEQLTEQMLPTLRAVAGVENVSLDQKQTVAGDFSCYEEVIPGLYFYSGITPKGV